VAGYQAYEHKDKLLNADSTLEGVGDYTDAIINDLMSASALEPDALLHVAGVTAVGVAWMGEGVKSIAEPDIVKSLRVFTRGIVATATTYFENALLLPVQLFSIITTGQFMTTHIGRTTDRATQVVEDLFTSKKPHTEEASKEVEAVAPDAQGVDIAVNDKVVPFPGEEKEDSFVSKYIKERQASGKAVPVDYQTQQEDQVDKPADKDDQFYRDVVKLARVMKEEQRQPQTEMV
jgi:hypothetical protein